jgi:hypothetical protein
MSWAVKCWATRLKRQTGRGNKLQSWARSKIEQGEKENLLANFQRSSQKIEFKHKFEFKQTKQCNSMCATVNPYSSLI